MVGRQGWVRYGALWKDEVGSGKLRQAGNGVKGCGVLCEEGEVGRQGWDWCVGARCGQFGHGL